MRVVPPPRRVRGGRPRGAALRADADPWRRASRPSFPSPPFLRRAAGLLYSLAESSGISLEPEAFALLLELVRMDVKTSAIMQLLRALKDAKIRAALSRNALSR